MSLVIITSARTSSHGGVCGGAGSAGASTATRAATLIDRLSCGSSSPIQVTWLPKKSKPSRRSTGTGRISSAAACTRWRGRLIGIRCSTWCA